MSDLDNLDQPGRITTEAEVPENDERRDEGSDDSGEDLEYLSVDDQVMTGNKLYMNDGNALATPQHETLIGEPPAPNNTPTVPEPPTIQPSPPAPCADTFTDNQFTFDALETRVGRKRRTRDLHSILSVCTCGLEVSEEEIVQNKDVILCRRAGCETGWVSQILVSE
jgi:hypothetical protein